jgi:hypothetical protein
MFNDTLLVNSKSNSFLEECLTSVHPHLKAKKDTKAILSILGKIFLQ